MTEPTVPRPVPGPYRPVPGPAPVAAPDTGSGPDGAPAESSDAPRGLAGLEELPVAEHVAVFEAEHARLQRELGTIDPR
ncbi:hypothetical protein [Blastococcus sp. SYSU DS0619]